eukprot:gene15971-21163_t
MVGMGASGPIRHAFQSACMELQSSDGQVAQLRAAGCQRVVQETASGAKSDRPALAKLIASLGHGDVLVVTRLDRLARSTIDLLTILKSIAERGGLFSSLGEQWADTTTAAGRLMLTILGGLAEFERELIKARTAEGRERAKDEVRKRKADGVSVRELGRSPLTFSLHI